MSNLTIIWTDEPRLAMPLCTSMRQSGRKCRIVDASLFGGVHDLEPCTTIAFVNASKRDAIISAYRLDDVRAKFGHVEVIDVETDGFGVPTKVPEPSAPAGEAAEPPQSDALDAALDQMSVADLRTYVSGITGVRVPPNFSRERIINLLRRHQAGQDQKSLEADMAIQDRVKELTGGESVEATEVDAIMDGDAADLMFATIGG